MGQEMHDGLSQHIAGLAILASRLAESLKTENSPSAERAEKLAESIEDAKSQARALAKGLLPIDINSAGLVAALHELAMPLDFFEVWNTAEEFRAAMSEPSLPVAPSDLDR